MIRLTPRAAVFTAAFSFVTVCSAGFSASAAAEALVFRHAEIHPISAPPIADGALVIEDGKVVAVGPSASIQTPAGATEYDLSGKVVIPGMVDTHSHIGGPAGGDSSAPLNPEARSLDAIDVQSPAFWRARAGGITTLNVMPGSGHLMSGQTTYLKIRKDPRRIEDWLFCDDPTTGYLRQHEDGQRHQLDQGEAVPRHPLQVRSAATWPVCGSPELPGESPARRGGGQRPAPARDLRMEAMAQILDGSRLVQFHTHRHNDILTVIRLAREFGFTPVIQHGSDSWKVAREIAEAGLPVSVTYVEAPGGKEEVLGVSMRVGALLEEAGVDVSFNTDDYVLDSRLLLRYAALNVRNGMSETGCPGSADPGGRQASGPRRPGRLSGTRQRWRFRRVVRRTFLHLHPGAGNLGRRRTGLRLLRPGASALRDWRL